MLKNYGIAFQDSNKLVEKEILYNYENIEKEKETEDYILIENKSIGFGPYDMGFISGRLKTELKREFIIGIEGSGIIIKVGKNCDENLLNKRVAYLSDYNDPLCIGSFAKYSITKKENVFIIPEEIDFNQGAYILGNPLTAKSIFDEIISKSKTRAIVQDTSSSALGKMITKLCIKNNIKIINIIRKDDNLKLLQELGSEFNLNSTSENFLKNFENFSKEINPDIYITYQGGNFPSRIFNLMPNDSKMVSCGNINNEKLNGFSTTDFIFKGKTIEGFQVLNYLKEITIEQKENLINCVKNSIINGDREFITDINKEFLLEDYEKAFELYNTEGSNGKIILKP
jgi:NADPH2:quinone reductase